LAEPVKRSDIERGVDWLPYEGVDTSRVASIILGGGQGTRLAPLTTTTCKPAIPFGGRYRLVDIPISNSLNSDIRKIIIISQFLSAALHHHLFQTYQLEPFRSGFLQLLTAEQRPSGGKWFQGTADAIRQNLDYLLECPADYFLILSGDQLYNFDFRQILHHAMEQDADLTIAALPIEEEEASRMGLLKVSPDGWVSDFIEKPEQEEVRSPFAMSDQTMVRMGLSSQSKRRYLASMGIYVFKRQALWDLLARDPREDFGKHLIPTKVREGGVSAFIYDGYWEDIGTIRAFYEANLMLTDPHPALHFYDEPRKIYSASRNLPGPKINDAHISSSVICEGAIVNGSQLHHSILGPRAVVGEGTKIYDSIIMGANAYTPPQHTPRPLPQTFSIGERCEIRGAIIDRNVHIGNDVRLVNEKGLTEYDSDHVYIRDGIIVVVRGASIPDGFAI